MKFVRKAFYCFALWVLIPVVVLTGEVVSDVYNFEFVQRKAESLLSKYKASDILFIFDIDQTLIQACHPAALKYNTQRYEKAFKPLFEQLPSLQKSILKALVAFNLEQRLIQNNIPQIVNKLQSDGIKTIALSAAHSGKLHTEELTEEIRFQQLKSFSVDFSGSYPNVPTTEFRALTQHLGRYPVWHRGILLSNGEGNPDGDQKDRTLIAWLANIPLPKVICFVDDKKVNAEKMELALKEYFPEIEFVGVELKAYLKLFKPEEMEISERDFVNFWQTLIKNSEQIFQRLVYHPENWKDPLVISLLESGKPVSSVPMKEFLKNHHKKIEFENNVYFVSLNNGIKAVFKPSKPGELQDAKAEAIAYKASITLGFPYVPPTILTEINGSKGSLQLFVETPIDLLQPGAYEDTLKTVEKDDLEKLKLFYFVFGQWDSGPHNLLAVRDTRKTYLVAIDNSGICNRQFVRYGDLPFVRICYSEALKTNDWDKPFPFNLAKTIEKPTTENLKKVFGDRLPESFYKKPYGCSFRYVIYQNSIWRQFHFRDDSFVKSYTNGCSLEAIEAFRKLDLDTLRNLFSVANGEEFLTENYLTQILERRDQALKALTPNLAKN